jgi:hypothetical protein
VGEGDDGAQEGGVLHVASGPYQISRNDGLAVSGLESVQGAQPEGDSDSGYQPSGAQLGLVQKLR